MPAGVLRWSSMRPPRLRRSPPSAHHVRGSRHSLCHAMARPPAHSRLTTQPSVRTNLLRLHPGKVRCCKPWATTPSGWMPWSTAREWMPRAYKCNCWNWSWTVWSPVCPVHCSSGWGGDEREIDPAGGAQKRRDRCRAQSSKRSGLASSLAKASRVARMVRPSSSWATRSPLWRYAASLRSWIR